MSPASGEAILFSGHAFVRSRKPFNSWVSWNSRLGGGPTLQVRQGSFEVSAPQGMLIESRNLIALSANATMWRDEVGWAGTLFNRKECIHLLVEDESGRFELALSPHDGLESAWQALIESGVKPRGSG